MITIASRRVRGRLSSAAFLSASTLALAASIGAPPAGAAHGERAARAARVLLVTSGEVRAADRALVRNARSLARCHAAHRSCAARQRALQRAGMRLAAAQRSLASVASARGSSRARYQRIRRSPRLAARGETLTWSATQGLHSYVLALSVPGQPVEDMVVKSTSVTPPPMPGETVAYRVRTSVNGSSWSQNASITYPQPVSAPTPPVELRNPQSAPALTVSATTLSWTALAGIATYVLDTRVPGRPDSFSEVSGSSFTPPAVPGTTVHYLLRTAAEGSSWSPEATITYVAGETASAPSASPSNGSEEASGSSTVVGVDTGGWSGGLINELLAGGIKNLRVQAGAAQAVAAQAPGHIASVMFGSGGTIASIDPAAYAAEVLAVAAATHPMSVEVLNEPGGNWFWSDADTQSSFTAYARLTKAVHEALAALPSASRPAEICSWDGGQGGSQTFGQGVKAAGALAYCDGVTVHPYGGSAGQHGGALGDRVSVARAHSESGLPVYVTELGWPTAVGHPATGDSQQWTEAQQAENMRGFAEWAKSTGYVKMVMFFNAVDYGSNDSYGIETSSRQHKQSFATLAALSN